MGAIVRICARALSTMVIAIPSVSYEGRTGYGISEYLHQLDANARPVVPVE
jgi:hypothetical protein